MQYSFVIEPQTEPHKTDYASDLIATLETERVRLHYRNDMVDFSESKTIIITDK